MVDIWLEAMEDNEITAALKLDMSAAFDMVDHEILLEKLSQIVIAESALVWFRRYLSDRTQQVCIDGALKAVSSIF